MSYWFVDEPTFRAMIDRDEFFEWSTVYGELKGRTFESVNGAIASGKDTVIKIDVQGAEKIRGRLGEDDHLHLPPAPERRGPRAAPRRPRDRGPGEPPGPARAGDLGARAQGHVRSSGRERRCRPSRPGDPRHHRGRSRRARRVGHDRRSATAAACSSASAAASPPSRRVEVVTDLRRGWRRGPGRDDRGGDPLRDPDPAARAERQPGRRRACGTTTPPARVTA